MSKLKEADFYYGAILSTLLNNGICPMIIEGGTDRQVYDFTTDHTEFRLFAKYRSAPIDTKTDDYLSWQYVFSGSDISEIQEYISSNKRLSLGLVCGMPALKQREYAVLHEDEIKEILQKGKTSLTLSRIKGEHAFRVSVGGSREKAKQIKSNRLY